jgi:hypothetical protein
MPVTLLYLLCDIHTYSVIMFKHIAHTGEKYGFPAADQADLKVPAHFPRILSCTFLRQLGQSMLNISFRFSPSRTETFVFADLQVLAFHSAYQVQNGCKGLWPQFPVKVKQMIPGGNNGVAVFTKQQVPFLVFNNLFPVGYCQVKYFIRQYYTFAGYTMFLALLRKICIYRNPWLWYVCLSPLLSLYVMAIRGQTLAHV